MWPQSKSCCHVTCPSGSGPGFTGRTFVVADVTCMVGSAGEGDGEVGVPVDRAEETALSWGNSSTKIRLENTTTKSTAITAIHGCIFS